MTIARSFIVFLYALALVACGAPADADPQVQSAHQHHCWSNADCGPLDFCDTEQGWSCESKGVCAPRGVNLFCSMLWVGVCGCDGVTYANTCVMHKKGVSAAWDGPCEAPAADQ